MVLPLLSHWPDVLIIRHSYCGLIRQSGQPFSIHLSIKNKFRYQCSYFPCIGYKFKNYKSPFFDHFLAESVKSLTLTLLILFGIKKTCLNSVRTVSWYLCKRRSKNLLWQLLKHRTV